MPANLTPAYYEAEEAFRNASTKQEKIAALEEMLAVIPKHKGTDKLQADLKKKLSKIRKQKDSQKGGNVQEDPYLVEKQGAGQVVILGFPSTGKSSLVKKMTNAKVKTGAYPFTTGLPHPGMMPYEDIKIQLVDTPPLTEEGIPGPFMTTIKNGDFLLLTVDLSNDACMEHLQMLLEFLRDKRLLREEVIEGVNAFTSEDFWVVGAKSDVEGSEERLNITKELIPDCPEILPISIKDGTNLEKLRQLLFNKLNIVRLYSKAPGKKADLEKPFVLRRGSTVMDFAREIHRDIAENLTKVRIWGSARFDGQAVPQDYEPADKDIIELHCDRR